MIVIIALIDCLIIFVLLMINFIF